MLFVESGVHCQAWQTMSHLSGTARRCNLAGTRRWNWRRSARTARRWGTAHPCTRPHLQRNVTSIFQYLLSRLIYPPRGSPRAASMRRWPSNEVSQEVRCVFTPTGCGNVRKNATELNRELIDWSYFPGHVPLFPAYLFICRVRIEKMAIILFQGDLLIQKRHYFCYHYFITVLKNTYYFRCRWLYRYYFTGIL